MSDGLTTQTTRDLGMLVAWRRIVLEAVGILLLFTATGFAAGWLWEKLWTPITGAVYQGEWLPGSRVDGGFLSTDYTAERRDFDAIALYAIIGLLVALALGVLCALVARRAALVTLAAVVVGSVLASYIASRFGTHLGPPDPDVIATTAKTATILPGQLEIQGKSPYAVWPIGALVGLMTVYFLTSGGPTPQPSTQPSTQPEAPVGD